MKRRPDFYILVYVFAILVLVAVFCIIIWKLLFMSPCSDSTQHACVVDGWSIAGLAATILGIAATLLAFLGAFAVAYWWAKLDNRVTDQVNRLYKEQQEQVNQRVNGLLGQQEAKVKDQTQKFQRDFQELEKKLEVLRSEKETLESWIKEVIDIQFAAILLSPPEDIDEIAARTIDLLKKPEIAAQMVFKYLEGVEGRFIYGLSIDDRNGKSVPNLLFFWEKALHWQKVFEKFYPPNQDVEEVVIDADGKPSFQTIELVKQVQEKINEYRPRVEEWKRYHSV